MMQPLHAIALAGLIALAGCNSGEAPLITGGPTPTQAVDAILANHRILGRDRTIVEERVKLEATGCAKPPNGVVTCRIRLYSIGRGWSAPSMGRFSETNGHWNFDF